jgi:hypothetical protein
MSLSARHGAVLADGSRAVLLYDRGWIEELRVVRGSAPSFGIWAHETPEQIERTARTVVGPDEPFEGRTRAEMDAAIGSRWPENFSRRGSRSRPLS